jgi:hypothetical protein
VYYVKRGQAAAPLNFIENKGVLIMGKIEVKAIYDKVVGKGKSKHFVIGEFNSPISGGLYISNDEEIPEQVVITFENSERGNKGA